MGKSRIYFIQRYMKYTVKSPVSVLTIITLGLSILFYLVYTTNINVYKTYEGRVVTEGHSVYIQATLDAPNINESIYWYADRQATIFDAREFKVIKTDISYIIKVVPLEKDVDYLLSKNFVYIDIPTSKITVLSRILSRRST